MRDDLNQIEAAFLGTTLAGLPIGHGPSGAVLVADVDPDRLHEVWQAAEALVPVIERRPVMVTDDFDVAHLATPVARLLASRSA
ncbi:hypothetical protein ACIA47_28855 [Micromonospora sp. NPDC051227]|uniref:hypothetical protein n=1 Tax=Micromonospora sp. NPDC051227 TaxID=3364285 RepID=UPI001934A7B0|nr:hypothetical protein [Micromonospora sp. STR1s_5]